jgi:hypothetical protein
MHGAVAGFEKFLDVWQKSLRKNCAGITCIVDKFRVPDWGAKVDSGIGLSYSCRINSRRYFNLNKVQKTDSIKQCYKQYGESTQAIRTINS